MKKIITICMCSIIITLFLISTFVMYKNSKQIIQANNIYDNNVELLKSRNFSQKAIDLVSKNDDYKFIVEEIDYKTYKIKMSYDLQIFNFIDKKTIESNVIIQK